MTFADQNEISKKNQEAGQCLTQQDADFFWIIPCLSKTIIISDMIDFMKAKSCCETTHASTKQRLAVIYASFLLLKQEKCVRSTQNLIFFQYFVPFIENISFG